MVDNTVEIMVDVICEVVVSHVVVECIIVFGIELALYNLVLVHIDSNATFEFPTSGLLVKSQMYS